jgi:hypothetical protein
MVTNYPVEAPGPLSNPLMGFRSYPDNDHPYPTVFQQYISWYEIENTESDTVQKIKDVCNARWANLPTDNVKVAPRVFLDWDSGPGNEYWPADLQNGDWTSQQFKDRVVRLIGRLGEAWDNDPRVAWVQTGIIGYWGEQESPVGVSQHGWAQRMGDAFTNAFKNKKLVVRNMGAWPGYEMGEYWDSFGHPWQRTGAWTEIQNFNNQGRYLTQVIEGEVAYNWGIDGPFKDLYGGWWNTNANSGAGAWESSPEITLNGAQYTDNMIDVIRELHCSALGWLSGYAFDGRYGTDPNSIRTNAARMQKAFGYRFHLTEFACSARTEPGANLDVRFKVKNTGSAPFYENWPLAVVLINETTRQIVWKATLPNQDIRIWQPGHNYSYTSRVYQTPAQEHQIAASIQVPASLASGQYLVGLSILEPMSRTPGVFFAVTNFFKQSQSQPLMRIGIGANASSHSLTGVAFDDVVNDDKRYYTMTAQGLTNTLIGLPFANGAISLSPGNGSYAKDTGVEVTARANLGYAFSSWGGALAGLTNNPAIVVMDAGKIISANYVAVPTYTLTTSAANGSITLNPPGGVYNAGTVVTVTAIPNRGYAFGSWSGNLTGTINPTTITMNGSKSVTANFTVFGGDVVPWLETFTLPNGTKTDGSPTSWTATRSSGLFQVSTNRLMLNGGSGSTSVEGVFETAEISIAGGSVKVSLEVQSAGNLETGSSGDYIRFYQIVDGGQPVLIAPEIQGGITGTNTLMGMNITGGKLKLRIATKVSAADEYYYFDNLKVEDEVLPPTYTLTTSAPNGSITLNPPPSGGVYAPGTVVTVTANPNYGYVLSNWSGALGGSANPTTITMNGNSSVTANFSLLPLFTLATSAINGSISLNPSGGIYTTGTVVTLTAIPNNGCALSNWSGALNGSVSPMTLTMNGNKSVTATFTNGPTSFRINCGGSAYTAAGGVVFAADGIYNNGGSAYSTGSAISGTSNDPLYQSERWATSFSYNFPLADGIYEVTLMFAEIYYNSPGSRVFNVAMEGTQVITNLDIWAKVGMNAAYNVTNRVTVSDGQLNIAFSRVVDNAKISAIQVQRIAGLDCYFLPPVLQGKQLRLEWVGGGTLQTATNVLGTWSDISGAVSPYLHPATNPAQFFRVKQ